MPTWCSSAFTAHSAATCGAASLLRAIEAVSTLSADLVYLLGLTRTFTRRPPELRLSESELAEAERETAPS